ncbi:MAG: YkgJ family cysteine cluster protein [Caldimicrobium sp.]
MEGLKILVDLFLFEEEKKVLLLALNEYLEETISKYPLACAPGCNLCCTTKIYATSLEAKYLLEGLSNEISLNLNVNKEELPRPRFTHNQLALLYYSGEEPPLEEEREVQACPFLDERGLCKVYERRPLMCRIMVSLNRCSPSHPAEISEELYLIGLLALQIVENIDLHGLYGNLFDLLEYLSELKKGKVEEIPPYLLSNVEFKELPLLAEEKALRAWVGALYRKEVLPGKSFKELLSEIKENFKEKESLSFLKEIFST